MAFDFPTAPAVDDAYTDTVTGASYTFDGEKWNSAGSGGGGGTPPAGGVPEAPIDTKQYGRQDAAWTEVVAAAGGGITQAEADARYLQLTGGTVAGAVNINGNFKQTFGAPWFGHPSGMGMLFFCGADMTSPMFQINWQAGQMNIGFPGADHLRLKGGSVVEFAQQPTVNGTPIVMKTEHDALLARVAALEAALKRR